MTLPIGNLFNYDCKLVSTFINGVLMTNYSDGDSIAVAMNEDQFKVKIGNTGEATRSKTNNLSGRFTFSLMQSSPMNDVLTALMVADLVAPTGAVYSIVIIDALGTTRFTAPASWLTKWPDHKNAMEVQAKSWVYETGSLSMQFHGGNFPPTII